MAVRLKAGEQKYQAAERERINKLAFDDYDRAVLTCKRNENVTKMSSRHTLNKL